MFIKSHYFAFLQLNFTGFSAKPLRLVFFGDPKKKGRVYNSRHPRAEIREAGNTALPTGYFSVLRSTSSQSAGNEHVTFTAYL
ncbi:hypothetical protein [Candidatus Bartonella washoeensis]|uniref:hypothetical protein n=1 Tax=Candidatus Bartonella washoeensis TaxID=186739 RepID=UPI00030B467F|nr:hypothetical protein [Bartonella washoeensis]